MAFSETEKAQIRKVMCAPKRFLVQYGLLSDKFPLEDAMDQVGEDAETKAIIIAALSDIDSIDSQIDELNELGFVEKADDFGLNVAKGTKGFEKRGRQKIAIISSALGLQPLFDYYASARTLSSTEFI